ncbi:hypothetical membrane protein [Frankia alni ACN14a]|uniref:Hypothetical membrane protein n=1 Tax=Frankia alni (strain DSM 45986 / CECT 9034 / ACN14a) TaxID=326424 RepID=Q0RGS2_FRAAA|nr:MULTISPECIES: hypothetical protein [Frankia]CAJ63314.1 hypothetical membrane protein [Frankia alni ACN14a]
MTGGGGPSAEARALTVRLVTAIMVVVVASSFLFAFGDVWLLALRLGVPVYVAPLVAPAVDLSVAGLLLGIRFLAMRGADPGQLRPARRLLVFASVVTLALDVSNPMIAGELARPPLTVCGAGC